MVIQLSLLVKSQQNCTLKTAELCYINYTSVKLMEKGNNDDGGAIPNPLILISDKTERVGV
jgi:hypothetical protein